MPDQVRVPDPPTVSAPLPVKMSQDLLLHQYHDYAPPGTSPNGGSSVLLLSRSSSPLKRLSSRHGSLDWRLPAGTSPQGSSGYSDGSCGSSPARSPKLDSAGRSPPSEDEVMTAGVLNPPERPLSLVIRKKWTNQADPNSNVPEYTVHQRGSFCSRYPPYAPTTPPSAVTEEEEESHDSGTEEDLEPPLVISEAPEPAEEEEVEEEEQVLARDLSLKTTSAGSYKETAVMTTKVTFEANDVDDGEEKDNIVKGSIIKIRDFARFSAVTEESQASTGAAEGPFAGNMAATGPEDNMSDLSSECPESLSSVDTWQSNFTESRPFVPGACDNMVMRRVSTAAQPGGSNAAGGGETAAGSVAYQCDFCERIFGSKSHLQSHLVTHTGERAFNCRTCQKTFGRKSTLRAHMTTHTKTSNFMCTVCEKACNDNNSLEEHMRMHTGEKPFTCTICQKAYARKSHLNVHYRVHTGERPFVCHHCDKDFTEKRFLNDHLQTAHNGADGPLRCPNCCREFAYKTSLKQHLKKLMCERNINRGSGIGPAGLATGGSGGSSSSVTKQFQCPFCDKSYSWKQTLKQHVSMYHRNKVHTDEFWRHELTKSRRSMVDDKINEDLWRKQIGKHSEESSTPAHRHIKADPGNNNNQPDDQQQQLPWSEPAVAAAETAVSGQMTTEMKLLALQSLQNSLSLISRGMPAPSVNSVAGVNSDSNNNNMAAISSLQQLVSLSTNSSSSSNNNNNNSFFILNQPAGGRSSVKLEAGHHVVGVKQPESYLALLTQLARESEIQKAGNSSRASYTSDQEELRPLPMLPTKEESAVKRTQLWLQQVNRYRSSRLPREEADASNHEQLWEQQIARVKRNPVKSPLEPVEIVLDDSADAGDVVAAPEERRLQQQQAKIRQVQPMCAFNINNNNNMATNNNNLIGNNNNFAGNNNNDSLAIFQAKFLPLPRSASFSSGPSVTFASEGSVGHDRSAMSSPAPRRRPTNDSSSRSQTPSNNNPGRESGSGSMEVGADQCHLGEDKSMLKSLLLDRMKRKLSTNIPDKDEGGSKKANYYHLQQPQQQSTMPAAVRPVLLPEAPQDILRKRLLGWVDPPPAAAPQPATGQGGSNSSSSRSQQTIVSKVQPPQEGNNQQHGSGQSGSCHTEPEQQLPQQLLPHLQPPLHKQPPQQQQPHPELPQQQPPQQQLPQQQPRQQQPLQQQLPQQQPQQPLQQQLSQQQPLQQQLLQQKPQQQQLPQHEPHEQHHGPLYPQQAENADPLLQKGGKISVSYAHTSVLKHLLHRYTTTSMGQ